MLSRQALSALNAARSRTLCRALRLPFSAAPALRLLSTTGRRFEPEGSLSGQIAGQTPDLPASLLAKLKTRSASATRSGSSTLPTPVRASNETSTESQHQHEASASGSPSAAPQESPSTSAEPTAAGLASDSFSNLKGNIKYEIYKALTERPFKFEKMSSVQEAVLNLLPGLAQPVPANAGEVGAAENTRADLLVKAKTGTGKTVAFLVPALEARFKDIEQERQRFKEANPSADSNTVNRHIAQHARNSVGTVILSPTRELATQIANEAAKLISHIKGMHVQLFIGGASKGLQLRDFERNSRDIIVATPGRMNDMLSVPMVRDQVAKAKVLVLDEADTLLDMGFKDAIDSIVQHMPPKTERQTFLFSATVSPEIRQIARSTLKKDHKFIDCVPANETNTHLHIPQYSHVLSSPTEQFTQIARLLTQDALLNPQGGKAIIFLPTTKMTELTAMLVKAMRSSLPWGIKGTRVFEMHSKKTQGGREKTSAEFRAQSGPGYSILVTSDVSARGVDYPGVTRVIQVGVPGSKDTYVHRIGRTGRAGKSGRGDIILLPWEAHYLQSTLQQLPLQPSIVKDFQAELETLAEQVDANPPAPVKVPSRPASRFDRRPAAPISLSMQHPVLPRVQKLEHRVTEEIIPELSEIDAQEAFASQLGFYVARSPELRMSRAQVYEELQNWAVEALGLAQAPNVSPRMMQTLGIGKTSRGGKTKGFGVADSRRRGYEDLRSFRNDGPRSAFRPFRDNSGDRSDQRPSYGSRDQPRTFGNRDQPRMFGSRDQRPSYGSRDGGNRNSDRSGPFERRDRRMPF